jgi:transposase
MTAADELLEHARGKALLGDTGYDSTEFRRKIRARGMKPVICCHPSRKRGRTRLDRKLYRNRYKVECSFHSLKRFRAVATRYDKRRENYLGMVHVACICLWLK